MTQAQRDRREAWHVLAKTDPQYARYIARKSWRNSLRVSAWWQIALVVLVDGAAVVAAIVLFLHGG